VSPFNARPPKHGSTGERELLPSSKLTAEVESGEIEAEEVEKAIAEGTLTAQNRAYASRLPLLRAATKKKNTSLGILNFSDIAKIWRGWFIIRAIFLAKNC